MYVTNMVATDYNNSYLWLALLTLAGSLFKTLSVGGDCFGIGA